MTSGRASLAVAEQAPASSPPERRGIERDAVRLMVADAGSGSITHATFARLGDFLDPGDVLVVNVSATVPAAVDGFADDVGRVRLHISSPIGAGLWTVEPRRPLRVGSDPWPEFPGGVVQLPAGAAAHLLLPDRRSPRLWVTDLAGIDDVIAYLHRHGRPIRYRHTAGAWPLADYQTVYATEPGSAEMPSAGRPFTTRLVTSLVAAGISVLPVVLHSGVASFEAGELPDSERFRVPQATARIINEVRRAGGRVVAVGTTVVRAVETVADASGTVHPGAGVTDLIVDERHGVRGVDGIITGWHDSGASHLEMVAAFAGRRLVERCYVEAGSGGYLRHEFGDSLLVTASRRL